MKKSVRKAIQLSVIMHFGAFFLFWILSAEEPKKDDRVFVELLPALIAVADSQAAQPSPQPQQPQQTKPEPKKPEPKKPEPKKPEPKKPEPKKPEPKKPEPKKPEPKKPEPKKPEPKKPNIKKVKPPVIKKVVPPIIKKLNQSNVQRQNSQNRQAIREQALKSLESARKGMGRVSIPKGPSTRTQSGANYGALVQKKVQEKWNPVLSNKYNGRVVEVKLVIARSGHIISKKVVESSGDLTVDAAARKTLDRLRFIARFPQSEKEDTLTYTISLKVGL